MNRYSSSILCCYSAAFFISASFLSVFCSYSLLPSFFNFSDFFALPWFSVSFVPNFAEFSVFTNALFWLSFAWMSAYFSLPLHSFWTKLFVVTNYGREALAPPRFICADPSSCPVLSELRNGFFLSPLLSTIARALRSATPSLFLRTISEIESPRRPT